MRGGGNSSEVWVRTASFRNNHCLLGLFDLSVVWWFCEMSVFCWSGHLSAWLFGCKMFHAKDIYYIFSTFCMWLEIYKNQGPYLLKKEWKIQLLKFFEKFYHLSLLEMILNESFCKFCFLTANLAHIYSGKLLILMFHPIRINWISLGMPNFVLTNQVLRFLKFQ